MVILYTNHKYTVFTVFPNLGRITGVWLSALYLSRLVVTSTPKRLCKWIRTARAALIRGAGEQLNGSTENNAEWSKMKSLTGQLRHKEVTPVTVPTAGLWSQSQTGLGAALCHHIHGTR